ncbi:MAG TPA: Rieske (2Fe-2S) protein [Bacteroidales bacterium]|nr:Rieske (2Fe-2S) protein [Bacteroidales bacterium]
MNRRSFFIKILLGISALAAALIALPVVGALLEPILRKKVQAWRHVGKVDDFTIGKTVLVKYRDASILPWTGTTSKTASWLRRVSEDKFEAFSVNCTHLGCPVRWVADAELFLCPCHGGVYGKDGAKKAGPPPFGLPKYPVRINHGKVEIQTSPIPITNL